MMDPCAFVLRSVEARLALVRASDDEVAFVEVLLSAVKFWRVLEPVVKKLPTEARPEVIEFVKEPRDAKKLVEVAFVTVAFPPIVTEARVLEPKL